MSLAREFRQPCWRGLLASVSAQTVIEWRDYFFKHGFSEDMANLRAAMLASSNWNITSAAAGVRLDNPATIADFLPGSSKDEPEMSDDQMMAMGAASGGFRIDPSS